ncbi:MAG: S1 family peptidase [Pseudobdellovibrio sp.]|nr:S1 family peptidase [Pseudobdellovibrio sp.]
MKPVWLILLSIVFINSCDKKENAKTVSPPPAAQQGNNDCEKIRLSNTLGDASSIIGGTRVLSTDPDAKTTAMIISTEKNTGESFVCTATPITNRTLITAAHCLDRASKVTAIFYVDLLCSSGFKFSRDAVRAVDFKWHPDYDPNVMNSGNPDIGLVHLSADIKPGYPVYEINLAPENLNSDLFLYGYGVTGSNNSDSTVLRKVRLARNEYGFELSSIVIANNGVRGICLGDSGGPGLVRANNELQIATVNSFGFGPRNDVCGGRSSLILIHPFMPFIHDTLQKWGESLPTPMPGPTPAPQPPPPVVNIN